MLLECMPSYNDLFMDVCIGLKFHRQPLLLRHRNHYTDGEERQSHLLTCCKSNA